MQSQFKEEILQCLSPITEENNVGIDAKYSNEFTLITKEMDKIIHADDMDKITYPDGINWKLIINNSLHILIMQSKDINIAGYLCLSLFKEFGYNGLNSGFEVYKGLLNEFKNNLFPQKKKEKRTIIARKNAFQSFEIQIASSIRIKAPDDEEFKILNEIETKVKEIQSVIYEQMKIEYSFFKIIDQLKVLKDNNSNNPKANKSQDQDEPVENHVESVNIIPQKNPSIKEKEKTDIDSKKEIDPKKEINSYASTLLSKNLSNPIPYKIHRIILWDSLKCAPQIIKENKTKFPYPIRKKLSDFDEKEPIKRIKLMERLFVGGGLFLLDIQRKIVQAMQQEGPGFKEASESIKFEVFRFCERFPNIVTMTYSNEKEFADKDTREWIDQITNQFKMNNKNDEIRISFEDTSLANDFEKALNLAKDNELQKALELLHKKTIFDMDRKNIFCRRLYAGHLCLNYNHEKEAMLIMEDLFEQAIINKLEYWDTQLFSELCTGLEKAYQINNVKHTKKERQTVQKAILRLGLKYTF